MVFFFQSLGKSHVYAFSCPLLRSWFEVFFLGSHHCCRQMKHRGYCSSFNPNIPTQQSYGCCAPREGQFGHDFGHDFGHSTLKYSIGRIYRTYVLLSEDLVLVYSPAQRKLHLQNYTHVYKDGCFMRRIIQIRY